MSRNGATHDIFQSPGGNAALVVFQLMHDVQQLTHQHLCERVSAEAWLILHQCWVGHLLGREVYIGDLLGLGHTPDAIEDYLKELIQTGLLEYDNRTPSSAEFGLRIQLTTEGVRRSRALATQLLQIIHEHCSLAGINPFARRAPAWGTLNNRRQNRSNRRSRPHPRQS